MVVGTKRDLDYDVAVEDRVRRETREIRMTAKYSNNNTSSSQNAMEEIEDDEDIEEDESDNFEPTQKPPKKDKYVTLTVDRKKLVKETATGLSIICVFYKFLITRARFNYRCQKICHFFTDTG